MSLIPFTAGSQTTMVTVTSVPQDGVPKVASKNDVTHMIIKYLKDVNMDEAAHALEKESGVFFDLKHFEALLLEGDLDDATDYLSGFTSANDNPHSMSIFFEIKKQKFLEALDIKDRVKALDILLNEFKDFAGYYQHFVKETSILITMDDFREHPSFVRYGHVKVQRLYMVHSIRANIFGNPSLSQKMHVPAAVMSYGLKHLFQSGELAALMAMAFASRAPPKRG